ncbi:unnamed protein product [Bemisia tabaci]|uniref:Cell division cycle protein 27 homolog n=1 Tax=Bemisia tabaci TaxID=7038 RepID=A0A9P0ALT8_BEMTA|nr:unnamed protein product [Bemisia tabaci]
MEPTKGSQSGGTIDKEAANKLIEDLNKAVTDLYEFEENYFTNHPISDAPKKTDHVQEKLNETLSRLKSEFDQLKDFPECEVRAQCYYLLGRALNIHPAFNPEAEEALSKAIKLDPSLVNAWNELGECFWKKNDMEEAKNCFNGALKRSHNKVSLRNLSMISRQEAAKSTKECKEKIDIGVQYAKDALSLDPCDGLSWSVLGNAHLSAFFSIQQNPRTLKQAMSAYYQAEKDPVAQNKSDLHYNKGVALKYEEEYKEALESFERAKNLEPSWELPGLKQEQLLKYLTNTQILVNQHGRLKAKKLASLQNTLDEKSLGPYAGGNFTSASGTSVTLTSIPFSKLKEGVNSEKVILGFVVCSIHDDDSVPFSFCLTDEEKTTIVVTVYNLAQGKGVIIGDTVAIPEPFVTFNDFSFQDKKFQFTSVRIDNPLVMVVNGKKVKKDQLASTQLSVFKVIQ